MKRRRVLVAVVGGLLIGLAVDSDSPESIDQFDQTTTVIDLVSGEELLLSTLKKEGEILSVFITSEGEVIGSGWRISIKTWIEIMTENDFSQVGENLQKLRVMGA